jgi:two-component system chemotaxis sensor kinase CheA
MQPIATVWKQMPRTVRDVALAAFKQVRLEMEGGDTELDKTVFEAIRDPLNHLLRNAVDHGIQLPELRVALGKPAEGRIWMRAYHAGGQVNIEIADDGGGIDPQAIRRKALEQNLVPPAQLNQMNDSELLNLIFRPGFSTARQVTRLSGRGVGLDVVQSNIEQLGGTIRVRSTLGEGTSFTLHIPLTLAIVQALIVNTDGDYYAVPQSRVVECIHLRGEEAATARDPSKGAPMFRFRGRLTPIVYLRDLLRLPPVNLDSGPQSINLIVVKVNNRHFGLVVDQVVDNKEIVIKPIWQPLRAITAYAGATQLSDGTVALILDPVGLAKCAGIVAERHEENPAVAEATPPPDPLQRILLARLDRGGRVAVSTSGLKRLMKVQRSRIKSLHGQGFLEWDGTIHRVVDVAALLGHAAPSASETVVTSGDDETPSTYVALYDVNGDSVGLNVGPSVDIVQSSLDVRGKATRPHVDSTAMIDHEFVEVLDVDSILASAAAPDAVAAASPEE